MAAHTNIKFHPITAKFSIKTFSMTARNYGHLKIIRISPDTVLAFL